MDGIVQFEHRIDPLVKNISGENRKRRSARSGGNSTCRLVAFAGMLRRTTAIGCHLAAGGAATAVRHRSGFFITLLKCV